MILPLIRLKASAGPAAAPRALPRKGAKRAAKRDKGISPYRKSGIFPRRKCTDARLPRLRRVAALPQTRLLL